MATKTSKKQEPKAERGNKYALTASGKKALAEVTGQGALIFSVLKKGPATAADIFSKVGKQMKSESAQKNIAFYLSVWKTDGLVKFA